MQEVKGVVTTLMYSETKMAQQNLQNFRCVPPHQQRLDRPPDKDSFHPEFNSTHRTQLLEQWLGLNQISARCKVDGNFQRNYDTHQQEVQRFLTS